MDAMVECVRVTTNGIWQRSGILSCVYLLAVVCMVRAYSKLGVLGDRALHKGSHFFFFLRLDSLLCDTESRIPQFRQHGVFANDRYLARYRECRKLYEQDKWIACQRICLYSVTDFDAPSFRWSIPWTRKLSLLLISGLSLSFLFQCVDQTSRLAIERSRTRAPSSFPSSCAFDGFQPPLTASGGARKRFEPKGQRC